MHVIAAKAVALRRGAAARVQGLPGAGARQRARAGARAAPTAACASSRAAPIATCSSSTCARRSITGKDAEAALGRAHITVNKNAIPNDPGEAVRHVAASASAARRSRRAASPRSSARSSRISSPTCSTRPTTARRSSRCARAWRRSRGCSRSTGRSLAGFVRHRRMKCPFCGSRRDAGHRLARVARRATRSAAAAAATTCQKRFTTYETVELRMPQVVKTNGNRADFAAEKIRIGFPRALHKRPVPTEYVDAAIERIVAQGAGAGRARDRGARDRRDGDGGAATSSTRWATSASRRCIARSRTCPTSATRLQEVETPPAAAASKRGRVGTSLLPQPSKCTAMRRPNRPRAHGARARARRARPVTRRRPIRASAASSRAAKRSIGEGFHARAGEAHAEVAALADAARRGVDVSGATLYVTLEPCNAQGRRPPCVDAVLAAGIARVVAAMHDPNPRKAGGAARLREAGVAVDVGLLEDEARELNPGFLSVIERGRPWVRLKVAASLDGRTALANGTSQWITRRGRARGRSCLARARVRDPHRHRHRAEGRSRADRARGGDAAPAAARHRRPPCADAAIRARARRRRRARDHGRRAQSGSGRRASKASRCPTPTGASTLPR